MREVKIRVNGLPAPQGSKRSVGRGIMVESSKKVGPWRDAVRTETQAVVESPHAGPVRVQADFLFPRPKSHYRANGEIKENMVYEPHTKRPDIDKIVRSTLDGLTEGGLFLDDSQVVVLQILKRYVRAEEVPGVDIVAMLA